MSANDIFGFGAPPTGVFQQGRKYFDQSVSPIALWVYVAGSGWEQAGSSGGGGGAPVTQQGGGTYGFVLDDAGDYIQFTNAGGCTATIPLDADEPFPVNTEISLEQTGAGAVTIAAAGGVTLNSANGNVATAAQFAVATIKKVATDTWTLFGNLA